jgi:predicted nucleic acid-binding protein
MSATCFVDSNVLVYARDSSERDKQSAAHAWMTELWNRQAGRISYQALNEFYVTVTAKLTPGLSPVEAWADVQSLFVWMPLAIDQSLLIKAKSVQDKFMFSWWDSLIVAAAQMQGCTHLLTEDLQDEQDLDGLIVLNPFRHMPADIFVQEPD